MDLRSTIDLTGSVAIPRLGLGVFRAGGGQPTRDAVTWALERGYRHVDTAHIYRNEVDVGAALAASDVPRDEVFVTTKLWNSDQGYDATLRAFDASAAALGVEVVDLYLMHWPVPEHRLESWRAMERIHAEGRARAIGVSNFVRRHLDELSAHANVAPMVNQIELHPFGQQRDAVAASREHGVVVEAYSPVTKGQRFGDPTVRAIATETRRTPAQVLIRWGLQHGFVVIPKSSNQDRIAENASVFDFELDPSQMQRLDGLEEGLHLAWDPTDAP
ncbi:MAG: aldo/keto reductase [Sandaracinaceae bacterium]|nr:aldo/keto reductase [Sandaracinaceae bacterium]